MKAFAALYQRLDATTRSSVKRAAIVDYLHSADPRDAAHAVAVLSGQRPRRPISATLLREAAAQASDLPLWLLEESYHHVGDLAETLALLLPPPARAEDVALHHWMEQRLPQLARAEAAAQQALLQQWWAAMPQEQRLVFHKLLTGSFRVGVARQTVTQALATALGREPGQIAARMMGRIRPSADLLERLTAAEQPADTLAPYPFALAHALEGAAAELGPATRWQAEYKWDGIRAQLLHRAQAALWSRGEEPLDASFPELLQAAQALPPGCVLDGEIVAWDNEADAVAPFAALQRRLNRRKPGAALRRDVPVRFLAYDLLEREGEDLRVRPLRDRRQALETLLATPPAGIGLSPLLQGDWPRRARWRAQARAARAEGLMLKDRDAPYPSGRPRGPWWKWKLDPYTVDAVLLYAQAGHGRRSGLHSDFTLGVWQDGELVPVAKAYSGLSDAELLRADRWIRAHTRERFGPVRAVAPEQVFELAFEGLRPSSRHKAGLALRFPRILRWREDKPAQQADQLATLQRLLEGQ